MLICICLFLSIICFQIRVILLVLPQFVISCREPKDLAAQLDRLHEEMLNITLSGTPTYGILPPYRRNTPVFQTSPFKRESLKFRIYGKAKCKRLRYFEKRSHLNYRSSCPWYVYLDYDVDRLPQTMAKAECSCRKCFNTLNDGKSGNCRKIESFVPVIRRQCLPNNVYRYFVFMETVPVGCTCTRNVS